MSTLPDITVGRYDADPQALGVVKSGDGRWQVVVDKDGVPHLYVRCRYEAGKGGIEHGLVNVDDFLAEGFETIRDVMEGTFGGECTPEEEAEAAREWEERKAKHGIPCPR